MKAVVAIAAVLLIGVAQAAADWESKASTRVDEKTEMFVKKAAQSGMGEVELGRWALDRSNDADLKKFANHLVDDHGKANAELRQIAERLGISMPTPMTQEQMALQEKLSKLEGAEFKREFISANIAFHQKDIEAFQDYARNGTNEDVRAFAEKNLPALQAHLRMAQDFSDGRAMMHNNGVQHDVSYRNDDFRQQHNVGYDRTYSSTFVSSDDYHCGECVSYDNDCNTCEPSGSIVYDNDWRAGQTDFVTGEQVDLEECEACDWAGSIWH